MKQIFSLLFLFYLAMTSISPCYAASVTIYFYNPETNIDNFATLKTEFDSYLSEQGNYQFQPFDRKESFDTSLKKGNIYLLSSWHFDALLQRKIPLQPLLIGTFNGNIAQRKALSTKKEITQFAMLKNSTIAGSGSDSYIRSILQQIGGAQYKEVADTIKILSVPKDMDALMAVAFGMANAAVCAENSLTKFEAINPDKYKQLHNLGYSKKSYLLIAATLGSPGKEESKVIEVLYNMQTKESSQKNLNLLGLDGWQRK